MKLYKKYGNPMIKRVYTMVYFDGVIAFSGRPYYPPLPPLYKGQINYETGKNVPTLRWGRRIDTSKEILPQAVSQFISNVVYGNYEMILGRNNIPW